MERGCSAAADWASSSDEVDEDDEEEEAAAGVGLWRGSSVLLSGVEGCTAPSRLNLNIAPPSMAGESSCAPEAEGTEAEGDFDGDDERALCSLLRLDALLPLLLGEAVRT